MTPPVILQGTIVSTLCIKTNQVSPSGRNITGIIQNITYIYWYDSQFMFILMEKSIASTEQNDRWIR